MAGNVDFEPPVVRVLSRSVDRAEMGFPAVDRMITAIFQELDERSPDEGIVCSRNLADAVIVPVRYVEQTVFAVGRLILLQRPVGDTVAGGIRPRDQAATGRGADTAGIGLGEHDSILMATRPDALRLSASYILTKASGEISFVIRTFDLFWFVPPLRGMTAGTILPFK